MLTPAGATAWPEAGAGARRRGALLESGQLRRALRLGRGAADRTATCSSTRFNPDRIEGQRTVALEMLEQLGAAPDVLALALRRRRQHGRRSARVRGRGLDAAPRRRRGPRAATTWASAIRIADLRTPLDVAEPRRRRIGRGRPLGRGGDPGRLGPARSPRKASSASRRRRPASPRSNASARRGSPAVCILTGTA